MLNGEKVNHLSTCILVINEVIGTQYYYQK